LSRYKFNFQLLEQNNFALSEFVQNKKAESNYEPIKNKVSGGEPMRSKVDKLGTNEKPHASSIKC
jgi:hypothetical protein